VTGFADSEKEVVQLPGGWHTQSAASDYTLRTEFARGGRLQVAVGDMLIGTSMD